MADGTAIYNKNKTTLYLYYKNARNVTNIQLEENITSLGIYAFYICTNLQTLNIGKKVSDIGWEWSWSSHHPGLKTVNIDPDNPYYEVKGHGIYSKNSDGTLQTLIGCYGRVTEFEIADGVKEIGRRAFSSQGNLTKITIPNTVQYIGNYAFSSCINLKEIKIPNSVVLIEETAFVECTKLAKIEIDKEENSISGRPWSCPIGERVIINWLR